MIFILTGLVSGIISGMGIGGGTVLIPVLTVFMGIEQKTAQAINLIYFIPTAAIALIDHFRKGRIEKKVLFKIVLMGLLGAVAGSFIAMRIDSSMLRRCFGVFLGIMGCMEIWKGIRYKNRL